MSGRCSSVVEVRLMRFLEVRNVRHGGELMWVDAHGGCEYSTQIFFSIGKHKISLLRKHICQKLQVRGTLSRRIYNGEKGRRIYYDGERQHVMMIQGDIASIGGTGSTIFVYGGGGENVASPTRRK
ncbi:hypothetical protein F2Q70_00031068 [Brassica cretica]|uniref:Uncharacterized protein n=1 Tax=Brassica cretica TaxID=69181 RepID=A0A8S9FKI9_BRACR|nr:hypothetical protein F2Q70_00031068 [Brassica cretica]